LGNVRPISAKCQIETNDNAGLIAGRAETLIGLEQRPLSAAKVFIGS
jgi:hypothetical protein